MSLASFFLLVACIKVVGYRGGNFAIGMFSLRSNVDRITWDSPGPIKSNTIRLGLIGKYQVNSGEVNAKDRRQLVS